MALEDPLVVRQKVRQIVQDIPNGHATRDAIELFFRRWGQTFGRKQLELTQFSAADAIESAGTLLTDHPSAVHILVIYRGDGDTRSFLHLYNDNTTPYDTTGAYVIVAIREAHTSGHVAFPAGLDFGNGVSVAAMTSSGGSNNSDAADAPSGFVISSNL